MIYHTLSSMGTTTILLLTAIFASMVSEVSASSAVTTLLGSNLLLSTLFRLGSSELYVTSGKSGRPTTLHEIDEETMLEIRGVPLKDENGEDVSLVAMAFDSPTQTMYGVARPLTSHAHRLLVTVNLETGNTITIGPIFDHSPPVFTFDSKGNLFAWAEDLEGEALFSVDKSSGVMTRVGDSGGQYTSRRSRSISFDYNDILYLLGGDGQAFTVNTTDGSVTYLGTFMDSMDNASNRCQFKPGTSRLYCPFQLSVGKIAIYNFSELTGITQVLTVANSKAGESYHALAFTPQPSLEGDSRPLEA